MSKRSEPESPPDPFHRHRAQAAQLEDALKTLAGIESDIKQLHGELDRTEALLKAAHDADKADFDEIDRLTLRCGSINTRLTRDEQRLLSSQHDVQNRLSNLVNDLNTVFQITRNALIAKATDEICSLLASPGAQLQRTNVGFVAPFHKKVVALAELTPALHPMALQPLEDVPTRPWSLERVDTMRVCRQECARILESLPKLLASAKEIWSEPQEAAA